MRKVGSNIRPRDRSVSPQGKITVILRDETEKLAEIGRKI